MKRDMDLIRTILLEAEATAAEQAVVRIDGYDDSNYAYNVWLMEQAGLVEAAVVRASGHIPIKAHVFSLTWAGHDFLDAVRNDSIWAKTKARVAETAGSASFDVLKAVASAIALKAATGQL